MSAPYPLPAGLRQTLRQALGLVRHLQAPGQTDPDELEVMLEELQNLVAQAHAEVRSSSLPRKHEIARSLLAAGDRLLHVSDPTGRDMRMRLREVSRHLLEILE